MAGVLLSKVYKKITANPFTRIREQRSCQTVNLAEGNVAGTGAGPFIENGRTMIPLRAMADAFGFEVGWEQSEAKITLKKEGKEIIMYIGKPEIWVDGKEVKLEETVPMVKNNVTFLPVRQLAELLGISVEWDNKTRTAIFTQE